MPEMKIPGPDHPITIEPNPKRIQARYAGHVIADTIRAVTLKEASLAPVLYFPREDVSMEFLSRTERVTYCPYKGEAHYYTLLMDGRFAENVVWTYETPYPPMEDIRGRLAFYSNRGVDIYEVGQAAEPDLARAADAAPAEPDDPIAETILHTDAGAGISQREHWPPNVEEPPSPRGEGGRV
jgi:uncharacterized protein (DUF427 family)